MLWLDMTYMMKLKQLGIELEMYKRYVDDGNMVVEVFEPELDLRMASFPSLRKLCMKIQKYQMMKELQKC